MYLSTSESYLVQNTKEVKLVRKGQVGAKGSSCCERVKSEGGTRVSLAQPIPNYSKAYINPAGELPCTGTSTRGQGQRGCCETGLHPGKP